VGRKGAVLSPTIAFRSDAHRQHNLLVTGGEDSKINLWPFPDVSAMEPAEEDAMDVDDEREPVKKCPSAQRVEEDSDLSSKVLYVFACDCHEANSSSLVPGNEEKTLWIRLVHRYIYT
jgi:hypothetical protein